MAVLLFFAHGTACARELVQMRKCQVCQQEELYRVPRTTLEKVLFTQSYECRACGDRSRIARRMFAGFLGILVSRHTVRVVNGPRTPKDS